MRRATLALVRSVADAAWARTGTASGAHASARLFGYAIAGHVTHHAGIVESGYAPLLK